MDDGQAAQLQIAASAANGLGHKQRLRARSSVARSSRRGEGAGRLAALSENYGDVGGRKVWVTKRSKDNWVFYGVFIPEVYHLDSS